MPPSISSQHHSLGAQLLENEIILDKEEIRQCIRSVINSAIEASPYHGGVYLDNIFYSILHGSVKSDFTLGKSEDLLHLWTKWLAEGSSNAAYIPPEGLLALPTSAGYTDKADSWAVGCLLVRLLKKGRALTLKRRKTEDLGSEFLDWKKLQRDKSNFLHKLQALYAGAGQEVGLVVGPEFSVMETVPYACEEFLAHSLEPDPKKRWNLQDLSQLRFVDSNISLEELVNKETDYYETLPVKDGFKVQEKSVHPFLIGSPTLTIQLGEITKPGCNSITTIEIWKFKLLKGNYGLDDRVLYSKAYGKLLNSLLMEASTEVDVKKRAGWYGIRALQQGTTNVIHHYGCQFVGAQNKQSAAEFQVFTEHCTGENFQKAASRHIPLNVMTKWIRSVLCGLQFLHSHGIVHRNINSVILFFTAYRWKGTIKIGGFHNMRQLDSDRTVNHAISARRGDDGRFVAPEIHQSYKDEVNIGRKCDIWSVGCVLLHLVTGKPPQYTGQNGHTVDNEMAVIYHLQHQKKGPEIPEWVPASVCAFLNKCLEFQPEKRPSAADLLKESLEAPASDKTVFVDYNRVPVVQNLPQDVITHWMQRTGMES